MKNMWRDYDPAGFFDELMCAKHQPRSFSYKLLDYFQGMQNEAFQQRVTESELEMLERGITFTVYSDAGNIDRAWPLDIIPRAISGTEWDRVEEGLKQRLMALNLFIDDLYNDRKILKDKVVPADLIDEAITIVATTRDDVLNR